MRSWSATSPWSWRKPRWTRRCTLGPLFKFLDDNQIPHILFINKMDQADHTVREILSALQSVSQPPAGAAPGADPRCREGWRRYHGLCRSDQRACLQVSPGPGIRSDQDARGDLAARAGGPDGDAGEARRFRRPPDGRAAERRGAVEGRDLSASQQGSGRGSDRAGDARRGRQGFRRASPVEGACATMCRLRKWRPSGSG